MNNYNEKLERINKEIEALNKELDVIQANLEENANKQEVGLISIVDNALKIELLIDKDLFDEEDVNALVEIANQLQLLIVRVAERVEKEKKEK